jgi:hypothetical protein
MKIRIHRFATVPLLLLAAFVGCGKPKTLPSPVQANPQPGVANAQTTQPVSASEADWFQEAGKDSGIDFSLSHKGKGPQVVLKVMGGGAAVCDLDGDDKADLFLVAPEDVVTGRCTKLYRNLGKGKFEDVSVASGIDVKGMLMGCTAGDIDNDGKPDLLITGYGENRLYKNLGNFKFRDITNNSGLASPTPTSWNSSAAFADFDRDGKLDVYIGRYVVFDDKSTQLCDYGEGRMASCGPVFYDPQRGGLYRNLGGGKFKDVTDSTGFDDVHGKVLGVTWADVNADGYPDCYLANDEMNADLLVSSKSGKYQNTGLRSGVALGGDGKPQGGMGADWGDFNRDGLFDLWVTTYQFEPSSLYAATSSGLYDWQSVAAGLDQATRPWVGFGTKFVDVNNDGWLDLAIANGHIHDNQEIIDAKTTYREPMQLFVSSNNAATFLDKSREGGPGFTRPGVGRGLAIGDLDDDGRLDMVIIDMEGPTRVLFNRTPNTGKWIRIKLRGATSNSMGLGAVVTVKSGSEKWIANCTTDGSYLSSSDPRVHIGLGVVNIVDTIEVKWPSGKVSVVKQVPTSKDITIEEPR